MIYEEAKQDLFALPRNAWYFAQCISADFAMGKGIAVRFNEEFGTKRLLCGKYSDFVGEWDRDEEHRGWCIRESRVLNLITKKYYWHKPTLGQMEKALWKMKEICIEEDITKVAMPKIGCGLDRLAWGDVSKLIHDIFMDTDIRIVVCMI